VRSTIGDVVRHPTRIGGWWLDLPVRRLRFWRVLLFERGQGWLRWGIDDRATQYGYLEPPTSYAVAPPLRRAVITVRWWAGWLRYREPGEAFDWTPASFLRDDDRRRDLWER